jgi:putative ABC transport system ATP-binding protein/lipoprotein-releasing system ATP-binding protein
LIASGLRHRYHPHAPETLRGIDLVVESGDSMAIVGPSGSGKTTLLALLGGLLRVQSGDVTVETDVGADHAAGYVAWVPQTVNILADRSTLDNVVLGGFAAGLSRRDAVPDAYHWLSAVGLGLRAEDPIRLLSGGEVQRVVIARALATRRPLVLADEPTGQLDAATTASVAEVLFDSAHGRTVVVVTHDPEMARRCRRVLRLRDGLLYPDNGTSRSR